MMDFPGLPMTWGDLLVALLYAALTFVIGGIPFSVLLGRFALGVDIRQVGDGNPGATNVARAGGKGWGALAVLLDGLKALIPVSVAYYGLGISGPGLVPIALAAPLGHAYSPFLGFRGGKAIASIAGAWTGLTGFEAPIVMAVALVLAHRTLDADGWSAVFMLVGLLPYLLARNLFITDLIPMVAATTGWFLLIWAGHLGLVVWKHRAELGRLPRLRTAGGKG